MSDIKSIDKLSPKFSGSLTGTGERSTEWRVAEEVPVILLYSGEQFGVMMLTPADIGDFAAGFSLTEGIVTSFGDIKEIRIERVNDGIMVNIIVPEKAVKISETRMRSVPGRSSCGICGAQSLEAAMPRPLACQGLVPTSRASLKALNALSGAQTINSQNYSTHAAALCSETGDILLLREDVGRHNALDKLCGAMAKKNFTAKDGFLVLSSRFSVELAQKAAAMRFCFVATISAPTALALRVAQQAGMQVATLAGEELMVFDAG